jgi:hypothetical protein
MHRCLTALFVTLFGVIVAGNITQIEPGGLLATVDHLVYAAPELQVGIDRIESVLGVRATPGGQHPGRGTRNALLSLGPGTYLEIIGPDPEQPTPAQPRPFGIDDLKEPRLVTWAAKGKELEHLASEAGRGGVKLGELSRGVDNERTASFSSGATRIRARSWPAGLFRSSSIGGRRHIRPARPLRGLR